MIGIGRRRNAAESDLPIAGQRPFRRFGGRIGDDDVDAEFLAEMRDVIDGVAQRANFRQFRIGRYKGKRILQRLERLVNRMHAIALAIVRRAGARRRQRRHRSASFGTLRLALRRASRGRRVDRRVRSRGKRSAIATASVQVVRVTSTTHIASKRSFRFSLLTPALGGRDCLRVMRGPNLNARLARKWPVCASGRISTSACISKNSRHSTASHEIPLSHARGRGMSNVEVRDSNFAFVQAGAKANFGRAHTFRSIGGRKKTAHALAARGVDTCARTRSPCRDARRRALTNHLKPLTKTSPSTSANEPPSPDRRRSPHLVASPFLSNLGAEDTYFRFTVGTVNTAGTVTSAQRFRTPC